MSKKAPPNRSDLTEFTRRQFTPEARAFEVRDEDSGAVSGIGNRAGEIDAYSTVADPESPCYKPSEIEIFLKKGSFLANHRWADPPIGFFTSAKMDGRDFKFEATYHSTDAAQQMRVIATERKAADKTVGFSMGFYVSNYEWFEDGAAMLEALAARKRDLSLWNVEQIAAWKDDIWIMQVSRIVEISQVNLAANEPSEADSVRGANESNFVTLPILKGVKLTPDELLTIDRNAGILDERTVEEIAAESGEADPAEPVETVDGTERFAQIDAILARNPFKNRRRR